LTLPGATLRALKKRGIYCQSFLTLEFQSQLRRYVLRGTESGGAVADMGRYCAYLNSSGEPLSWLQPIDSLGINGRHAVVIAPELVRLATVAEVVDDEGAGIWDGDEHFPGPLQYQMRRAHRDR
jgi:hypothetical protein